MTRAQEEAKGWTPHEHDQDLHKGALEGNTPLDPQHFNPHGSGIDDQGLPADVNAVAEDVIGANLDETQG